MNKGLSNIARAVRVVALIGVVVGLSGCDQVPAANAQTEWVPVVWEDPESGCQYLTPGRQQSMTPRLNSDGKPMCTGGK